MMIIVQFVLPHHRGHHRRLRRLLPHRVLQPVCSAAIFFGHYRPVRATERNELETAGPAAGRAAGARAGYEPRFVSKALSFTTMAALWRWLDVDTYVLKYGWRWGDRGLGDS